jgi:hypothetical protein
MGDGNYCCEGCRETNTLVTELYESFQKVGAILGNAMENPMVRMMARNAGVPLEALENAHNG